jgi:O-antigen/teichoic acid export membrane protein
MALGRTRETGRASDGLGAAPLPGEPLAGEMPAGGAPGSRLGALRAHLQTPLFRNAYALIVNTGITALLGFVYWVVAARFYTTTDVGLAAAAISAMTLLAGISLFNLEAVMVRFIPIAGEQTLRLAGAVYALCAVAALIVGAIFIAGLDIWAPNLGFLTAQGGGVWFIVATAAWMMFILQDGIMVGLGRAVIVPIKNAIFGIGKLALLVALVGNGPYGIFRSWTIAAALVVIPFTALIFLRFVPRHARMPVDRAEPMTWRALRGYAAGDYVGSVFDLAAYSLLPLIVTHWAGPEENAFFYQSWIIAYTLILVANNASRALTVEAAKDQAQLHAYGRVMLGHTLKLLLPAVAVVLLCAPLILGVFGPEYAAGGTLTLRLLALAPLPHAIVLLALVTARLQQRLREVIAIQAATSITILGTSLALVGTYGGEGAAIGWLGGQTVIAVILLATRLRWLLRPGLPGAANLT